MFPFSLLGTYPLLSIPRFVENGGDEFFSLTLSANGSHERDSA